MKAKDSKNFLEALDELEREKGISKESVLEAIELALLAAYKKNYGEDENVEVIVDRESGEIKVLASKTVVDADDLLDPNEEISLEDAKEIKKRAKIGDVLKFEVSCDNFRRNAVQNGNVLNAPELKIRLADDSAETLGGRSTLIIVPNQ